MFRRGLFLTACLAFAFVLNVGASTANAQSLNYRGYARGTGTGFGCAFLPAYNNGQYFVKSFTASYVVNGVTRNVQLYYGSYFKWNGYMYNWQVPYVGPNVVVTVTLDFGFTTNPGPTWRRQISYVCPANPNVGGFYLIPSC